MDIWPETPCATTTPAFDLNFGKTEMTGNGMECSRKIQKRSIGNEDGEKK